MVIKVDKVRKRVEGCCGFATATAEVDVHTAARWLLSLNWPLLDITKRPKGRSIPGPSFSDDDNFSSHGSLYHSKWLRKESETEVGQPCEDELYKLTVAEREERDTYRGYETRRITMINLIEHTRTRLRLCKVSDVGQVEATLKGVSIDFYWKIHSAFNCRTWTMEAWEGLVELENLSKLRSIEWATTEATAVKNIQGDEKEGLFEGQEYEAAVPIWDFFGDRKAVGWSQSIRLKPDCAVPIFFSCCKVCRLDSGS